MECPDHGRVSVGSCKSCGREVCGICLQEVDDADDFECPDCAEYGVALYDEDCSRWVKEEDSDSGPSPYRV